MEIIKTNNVPIYSWAKWDNLEFNAREMLISFAEHKEVFHHLAVMPDCHYGVDACIGTVLASTTSVFPSVIGVDIGCGVLSARFHLIYKDIFNKNKFKDFIKIIEDALFNSFNGLWDKDKLYFENIKEKTTNKELNDFLMTRGAEQIGTMGGGNHFVEFQVDDYGYLCLTIHSGSRGYGHKVGTYYTNIAKNKNPESNIPFLNITSNEGREYFGNHRSAVFYASLNRQIIQLNIIKILENFLNVKLKDYYEHIIESIHNYISNEVHYSEHCFVHRKGAIATVLESINKVIIPGSMSTKTYLAEGLLNENSFNSCSHGAGRICSRNEIKKKYSIDDLKKTMSNMVYNEEKSKSFIDEGSFAYKDIDDVMENQKDLVKIKQTLIPVAVIKG